MHAGEGLSVTHGPGGVGPVPGDVAPGVQDSVLPSDLDAGLVAAVDADC